MFTYLPTRSASSRTEHSSQAMLPSKAAIRGALTRHIAKSCCPAKDEGPIVNVSFGVLAIRSLDGRSISTMLWHGGSPVREAYDERPSDRALARRSHQADSRRFEDATGDRDPRRHLAAPGT